MGKNYNKRIKVLFFISSLDSGGAEKVMVSILKYIDKEKFLPVLLLLYPAEPYPFAKYLPEDLEIIVVQRKSEGFIEKIRQTISILAVVSRLKPDVILSMLTHCNIIALLAKVIFRTRVIVSEHTTLSEIIKTDGQQYILGIPIRFMVKALYGFADKIISVSEGVKEDLTGEFGLSPGKISIIHNPVDLKMISELKAEKAEHAFLKGVMPVIVSVGRLAPVKGFDILLKVFKKVIDEADARLLIIGKGPLKSFLENEASVLGISEKVSFTGFQENPFRFMSRADLYVLSSHFEGMSLALLEAMACGLPVVAFDCKSGPRDVLEDGKYGVLVPAGNEERLAAEIIGLLKDNTMRDKLSSLGKERVKNFSVEKIVGKYELEISDLF